MAQHPLKDGLHPGQITTTSSWDTGHADSNVNINANSNLRPHPPGFGSSGPGKSGSVSAQYADLYHLWNFIWNENSKFKDN